MAALMFNDLLRDVGLDPADVRLLRHAAKKANPGRSPYDLWNKDVRQFVVYQSFHSLRTGKTLTAPFWAVFVATPKNESLFVGIYRAKCRGVSKKPTPRPQIGPGETAPAGERIVFEVALDDRLAEQIGILCVDWGTGFKQIAQYAERNPKRITNMGSRRTKKVKR